jgi:DNA-directed RNA polymerase subunit RPC12/RpoP
MARSGPNPRIYWALIGEPPWECHFCQGPVLCIGQKTWDGNVHHKDNDAWNNDLENIVVAHVICHQRHHEKTDEIRAKISATLKGRSSPTKGMKFSDEVNKKKGRSGVANAQYGKPITQKVRAAVAKSNKQTYVCEYCNHELSIKWKSRHRLDDLCKSPVSHDKLPRYPCINCGRMYPQRWMKRHKDEGRCILILDVNHTQVDLTSE